MPLSGSHKAVIVLLALVAVGIIVGVIFLFTAEGPETTPVVEPTLTPVVEVVGTSVQGRNITAYSYGTGAKHLLFVGGVHGGYEWNSVLLAYQFMDYFEANPDLIPSTLTLTIIPSANPDGVFVVTGKEGRFTAADVSTDTAVLAAGRFNAHKVDLNRNFNCHWKPESSWQNKTVSAGTAAFSEPEAQAIRKVVDELKPVAVVFWHSQSNAVYASECDAGVLPGTLTLMNTYASASGYPPIASFDAYPITGDAEGWLASINIPAVTVELSTHTAIEWEKNLAGVKALLGLYGKPY